MTAVEKRFLTGFRSEDADTPGLVQEDAGTVWLVAPDGTRTQISGGGSSSDVYVNIAVGITGLQDESGADFQWNVSRLRPGNNYSVMTAVIGPMTAGAGAGGYVTINGPALSDLNGQTLTLTYGEIRVSNAAGTEKLIASTAAPTAFTTDHQVLHVLVDDGFIIEQVGSDLSVDSNGYIVSAAGGQFFVSGLVQARLT